MRETWSGRTAQAAALLFVAALQVHRLDDADTWWHLATGRLIHAMGAVPTTDPFSFTATGAPWINRQWLFELGLYWLWLLGGPTAVILGTGVLFLGAFACVWALARRYLPAWAAAAVVYLAAAAAVERFTVRPEAATLCLLAVEMLLLDGRMSRGRAIALVVLQVLWANVHALSVLGLVPLGAELSGALAARWLPLPAGWRLASRRTTNELGLLAVVLVCAILAQAATPFGIAGATYPFWLLTLIRGADPLSFTIVEHRATTLAELSPVAARGLVGLVTLTVIAAAASVRRWRVAHLLSAAAFVTLAFMARRNVALLGIGVLPLVASGLGPPTRALDERLGRRWWLRHAANLLVGLVLLRLAGQVVTGRYYEAAHLTRSFGLGQSLLLYPSGAVDFLQSHAPEARVFNDDALGGLLLWRAYPPRQVFFDGRLQVYPPAVRRDYQRVLDDPSQFAEVASRWGVTAAILHHPSPGRLELAAAIARLPGWRVAYLDAGGVVLLGDGRPPGQPVGAVGPAPAVAANGWAARLDRALAPLRPPIEGASAFYHRGRALLTLFGRAGAPAARADFEAALRLRPDYTLAERGRQVAIEMERR
jgi:hypothetical protein